MRNWCKNEDDVMREIINFYSLYQLMCIIVKKKTFS